MVHQNLSLVPEMTIWENIALGREQTGARVSWTTAAPSRGGKGTGEHRA